MTDQPEPEYDVTQGGTLATVGEQFLKRKLDTEDYKGRTCYVPGQHEAEVIGEERELVGATLTFVNAHGMAMAVPMVRPAVKGGEWQPAGVYRMASLVHVTKTQQLDKRFRVTKKMRVALEAAEQDYRDVVGDADQDREEAV